MLKRLLCAVAVSLSALAAEVPVAPSAAGPSPHGKRVLGVATTDEGGFFAVWSEAGRLFATFLTRDGVPLDPRGTFVSTWELRHVLLDSSVRAEGGGYVLTIDTVYTDLDVKPSDTDWFRTRVTFDRDGRTVAKQTTVFENPLDREWPKNAAGETIAFAYDPSNGTTTLSFVGADGQHRSPRNLGGFFNVLGVVPDGDHWLVAAERYPGVATYRIRESSTGLPDAMLHERLTLQGANHWERHSAQAGGQIAILTEEHRDESRLYDRMLTLTIFGSFGRIKHILMPKERIGGVDRWPHGFGTASLAKDGNAWLVAYSWFGPNGLQALHVWRVEGTMTKAELEGFVARYEFGSMFPYLAVGTRNLVLYQRQRDFSGTHAHDLMAQAFDRGGLPTDKQPASMLASSRPPQDTPHALAGPDGVVAVWREGDTRGDLKLRFFGTGEDAKAISSPHWDARRPVLARSGDTWLVAWEELQYSPFFDVDRQRVVMQRFDARGDALDTEPLILASHPATRFPQNIVAVAETNGFRLAWGAAPNAESRRVVYTTRVEARGPSAAEPEAITVPTVSSFPFAAVSNGGQTLLLWSEDSSYIRGKIFTDGVEQRGRITFGPGRWDSAAAAAGGELLLVRMQAESESSLPCAAAQRHSFDGTPLGTAYSLDCATWPPGKVFAVHDAGRWWVKSTGSERGVWEIDAGGVPVRFVDAVPEDVQPLWLSIFATGTGPSFAYVRNTLEADWIDRAFLRTFPRPRARGVRH